MWNAHDTVFGSKRSAVCAHAVYFMHSTRPNVTWLNSRWWLAACDWAMLALSAMLPTRVGRRRKVWKVSCTECTGQRNDFELIPTIKMETRNPVDGYFGSEFWRSYGGLKSHNVFKMWEFFAFFLEKRPLMVKFSKFCSESFHRLTERRCCLNVV